MDRGREDLEKISVGRRGGGRFNGLSLVGRAVREEEEEEEDEGVSLSLSLALSLRL